MTLWYLQCVKTPGCDKLGLSFRRETSIHAHLCNFLNFMTAQA